MDRHPDYIMTSEGVASTSLLKNENLHNGAYSSSHYFEMIFFFLVPVKKKNRGERKESVGKVIHSSCLGNS